jgi:hypothetical protein
LTSSKENWKNNITELRRRYSARKKLALRTEENGSLSSQSKRELSWTTPVATDLNRTTQYKQGGTALSLQVKQSEWPEDENGYPLHYHPLPNETTNQYWERMQEEERKGYKPKRGLNWPTPKANCANSPGIHGQGGQDLQTVVAMRNWPTPTVSDTHTANLNSTQQKPGSMHSVTLPQSVKMNWTTPPARDYKDTPGMSTERDGNPEGRLDQLPRQVYHHGQQDLDKSSTNGNTRVLNPNWVLQLMGTTIEKTFFAWREMESSNRRPD